jgi:4-diphosphocytidyl-2-C-methyl-D-erythritol kinase
LGLTLACNHPQLPLDARNLVHRAATDFLIRAGIRDGVSISLSKRIPMEAGLGGGSSNAAHTLLGLNELFGNPLDHAALHLLAMELGSDVPFFLEDRPALAVGRGEQVTWCDPFPALEGCTLLLVHPGFGVPTPWAYRALGAFPAALHGQPGRAQRLLTLLAGRSPSAAAKEFHNALEAPVLHKYPILALFQEFFRAETFLATLMSGSGSTTFALLPPQQDALALQDRFHAKFGSNPWSAILPV